MTLDSTVAECAARLLTAAQTRRATTPVRDVLDAADIATAYAVQQESTRRLVSGGQAIVGRKIGLTSPAVQRQLGVDQPDFGVLFADMNVSAAAEIPSGTLLQPKVEAEVAFVLRHDLAEGDLDVEQVGAAIDYAVAALEIVDSRIADWDITIVDTVADNASSGLFVLGEKRLTLDDFEPRTVPMRLYADGRLVSEGSGSACLGDPINALTWLARTARQFGEPLRAGHIVLTGALGPMITVRPGMRIRAEIGELGVVSAAFTQECS